MREFEDVGREDVIAHYYMWYRPDVNHIRLSRDDIATSTRYEPPSVKLLWIFQQFLDSLQILRRGNAVDYSVIEHQ